MRTTEFIILILDIKFMRLYRLTHKNTSNKINTIIDINTVSETLTPSLS